MRVRVLPFQYIRNDDRENLRVGENSPLNIVLKGCDIIARTVLEETQDAIKSSSQIDIEVDIVIPKSKSFEDKEYKCSCCGASWDKQKGHFSLSKSILYQSNNSYTTVCVNCRDKYYIQLVDLFSGSEEKAIKYMCQQFGWFFHPQAVSESRKVAGDRSRISHYLAKKNLPQTSKYGKIDIDTLKYDYENRLDEIITSEEDIDKTDSKSEQKSLKNASKVWGFGFTTEEYSFLNNELSDWKAKVVVDGKSKESLVKELCMLKLQQNKALIEGKIDLYTKLTDAFQKTLDRANLTPKIEEAAEKAGELPMGMMIDRFENDDPIPEPQEEWKDVDGIIKMFSIYFLGHMCKMLNVKNRFAKMYENEMAKYRVEIPELESMDDDEVFDFLVNGSGDQ